VKVVYWLLWILLLSIWALLVGGIDRKIVARLQGRYGPPFWQNITDFVKLLYQKRKVASRSALMVVDAALVMGIVAAVLALSVLPFPMGGGYFQLLSTNGDLIIFAYAFALMAMVYVLIGFGGKSPYTLVGASREISMLLSYEVPFILLIVALGYRAVFVTGLPVESIFSMSALLVAKSQLGTLLMDPIFLGTFLVLLVLGPAIVVLYLLTFQRLKQRSWMVTVLNFMDHA